MTASVVALLLVATYRSPVLWLAPLLVIGFADRIAASVGTAVASVTGLSFDGSVGVRSNSALRILVSTLFLRKAQVIEVYFGFGRWVEPISIYWPSN